MISFSGDTHRILMKSAKQNKLKQWPASNNTVNVDADDKLSHLYFINHQFETYTLAIPGCKLCNQHNQAEVQAMLFYCSFIFLYKELLNLCIENRVASLLAHQLE